MEKILEKKQINENFGSGSKFRELHILHALARITPTSATPSSTLNPKRTTYWEFMIESGGSDKGWIWSNRGFVILGGRLNRLYSECGWSWSWQQTISITPGHSTAAATLTWCPWMRCENQNTIPLFLSLRSLRSDLMLCSLFSDVWLHCDQFQ